MLTQQWWRSPYPCWDLGEGFQNISRALAKKWPGENVLRHSITFSNLESQGWVLGLHWTEVKPNWAKKAMHLYQEWRSEQRECLVQRKIFLELVYLSQGACGSLGNHLQDNLSLVLPHWQEKAGSLMQRWVSQPLYFEVHSLHSLFDWGLSVRGLSVHPDRISPRVRASRLMIQSLHIPLKTVQDTACNFSSINLGSGRSNLKGSLWKSLWPQRRSRGAWSMEPKAQAISGRSRDLKEPSAPL